MTYPTGRLRSISLTVEEPDAGDFRWLLLESNLQGEWIKLSAATISNSTYRAAMAQGLLALQGLIDDLEAGPRDTPADNGRRANPRGHFGFAMG